MVGNCKRLLFVEDHADTREVIGALLKTTGLEVHQAANADSALALAGKNDFDVVLLDIGLPGMNGLELLRRLRALRKVPSIALTAYAYPNDIKSCYDAGFDKCLVKPVQFDALMGAIRELCA